ARAFLLWDKARVNGKLMALPGLQRRRAAEAHLFLTPGVPATTTGEAAAAETVSAAAIAVPEESGVSPIERPAPPVNGKVTVGTGIAVTSGAAHEAIGHLEPVRSSLDLMGLSPPWVMAGLAILLLGALAYVGVRHLQARRVGAA